jgi:hypothetical protein
LHLRDRGGKQLYRGYREAWGLLSGSQNPHPVPVKNAGTRVGHAMVPAGASVGIVSYGSSPPLRAGSE